MGYLESLVAGAIHARIREFVRSRGLGVATGPGARYRKLPGLMMDPDVAFASWERHPDRRVQTETVAGMVPELAVEIVDEDDTPKAIEEKRNAYFEGGVLSIWVVHPRRRIIAVYDHRTPEKPALHAGDDAIEMEEVLPGFHLPLADVFGELDEQAPETP